MQHHWCPYCDSGSLSEDAASRRTRQRVTRAFWSTLALSGLLIAQIAIAQDTPPEAAQPTHELQFSVTVERAVVLPFQAITVRLKARNQGTMADPYPPPLAVAAYDVNVIDMVRRYSIGEAIPQTYDGYELTRNQQRYFELNVRPLLPSEEMVLDCTYFVRAEHEKTLCPLFPEPGTYRLRFTLTLPSNQRNGSQIDVQVRAPEGSDKDVYALLRGNRRLLTGLLQPRCWSPDDAEKIEAMIISSATSSYVPYLRLALVQYNVLTSNYKRASFHARALSGKQFAMGAVALVWRHRLAGDSWEESAPILMNDLTNRHGSTLEYIGYHTCQMSKREWSALEAANPPPGAPPRPRVRWQPLISPTGCDNPPCDCQRDVKE